MALGLAFTLAVDRAHHKNIVSKLRRIGSFDVKEEKDEDGELDLVCKIIVPSDNAARVAEICNSVMSIEGVRRVNIFTNPESERFWSYRNPLIPIVGSTVITFLAFYQVAIAVKPVLTTEDIFNIIGVPTIATFISQIILELVKRR